MKYKNYNGASTPLPSFHLYNITRRVYLFLLLLIVLLVFIHFLEHKTRVLSCYVDGLLLLIVLLVFVYMLFLNFCLRKSCTTFVVNRA